MEYSIRTLVIMVLALIVVVIAVFAFSSWAQGSQITVNSFFDWIKNIAGMGQ